MINVGWQLLLYFVVTFSFRATASTIECPSLAGEYQVELKDHDQYESLKISQTVIQSVQQYHFEEGEGGDQYTYIADGRTSSFSEEFKDAGVSVEVKMVALCLNNKLVVRFKKIFFVANHGLRIQSLSVVSYQVDDEGHLSVSTTESNIYNWKADHAPEDDDPFWENLDELGLPAPGRRHFTESWFQLEI